MNIKIKVNEEMLDYIRKHSSDLRLCRRVDHETIMLGETLIFEDCFARKEDSNLPEGLFDHGDVACFKTRDFLDVLLPISLVPEVEKEINRFIEEEKVRIKEEDNRPRIYISGPISGHDIEERRKAFNEVEVKLRKQGYNTVNPTRNGLPAEATTHEHMRRDFELLMGCDYIYMMRKWTHSKGCMVELEVATAIGLPVMFEEVDGAVKFV